MADTGEDREIKSRLEANETEKFRESQQLARKTKQANRRRGPKLRPVDDPSPGLEGSPLTGRVLI